MDKKKTNLILVAAVLVIWGTLGYRIVSALADSEEEPLPVAGKIDKGPLDDYAVHTDTTRLRAHYRDPFGLAVTPPQRDTIQKMTVHVSNVARPVPLDMSFIKYAGYIANPATKNTLVMLLINGKTAMLNEGESAEGVQLIKNLRDSVKVRYHNQVRFIVKSSS